MKINFSASIVPFHGIGGIRLYSTQEELQNLLELEGTESEIINDNWIKYDVQNSVELFFHRRNNKLFRAIPHN